MLTRCPHCSATFRVKEEHLRVAQGMVRCGACMDIFNANEHILPLSPAAAPRPQEDKPAAVPVPPRPDTAATQEAAPEPPARKPLASSNSEADSQSAPQAPPRTELRDSEPSEPFTEESASAIGSSPEDDAAAQDRLIADGEPLRADDWPDDELIAELEDALNQPLRAPAPDDAFTAEDRDQLEGSLEILFKDQDDQDQAPAEPAPARDTEPRPREAGIAQETRVQETPDLEPGEVAVIDRETLDEDLDDDILFQDDPEEDKTDSHYQGVHSADGEPGDGHKSVPGMEPGYFSEAEDETREDEVQDESWAEAMLEQLQDEAHTTPEPAETLRASRNDSDPLAMPSSRDRFSSMASGQAASPSGDDPALEEEESSSSGLPRMLGWTLINVLMLLALFGQLAWFHYDKLARHESLRPLYQKACSWLGCTLPSLRVPGQIKSRNLVVRSHPEVPGALVIDVMAINEAGHPQPFPDIAFQFSDLNGRIMAYRLFSPEEYLRGEALNYETMPVGKPIHISLEIIDPGREAVNYTMRFQ